MVITTPKNDKMAKKGVVITTPFRGGGLFLFENRHFHNMYELKRSYLWPTIRAQSVLKNNIIAGYQRKTVGRADPVCRFRPYLTLKYLYVLFQEV